MRKGSLTIKRRRRKFKYIIQYNRERERERKKGNILRSTVQYNRVNNGSRWYDRCNNGKMQISVSRDAKVA